MLASQKEGSTPGCSASESSSCSYFCKSSDGPSAWALHPRERPGKNSWFWPGLDLVTAAIWGVNSRYETCLQFCDSEKQKPLQLPWSSSAACFHLHVPSPETVFLSLYKYECPFRVPPVPLRIQIVLAHKQPFQLFYILLFQR